MNYQILTTSSVDALATLVNRAIASGWEPQGGPFAMHTLGYYGQAVTRKQRTMDDFLQKKDPSPKQVEAPVLTAEDSRLFNALREKRASLAASFGGPAYCIATNKMLYAVVEKKPKTIEELGEVAGFGPTKIKLCGQEMVDIIKSNS
jgi:superfamily II DNA helicase RecQ